MAIKVSETFFSGTGTTGQDGTDEYSVFVFGNPKSTADGGDNADDPGVILLYGLTRFGTLSQFGNVFSNFSRDRLGPGYWKLTAHYKDPRSVRQTNDGSFSFTIGGGTQHITTSLKTTMYPADGVTPNNHHGAINVGSDGNVNGVDIAVGNYSFKTTFYVDPKKMDTAFLDELKFAVAKVNNDTVELDVDGIQQTFAPGELLLNSVDGQKRIGFGDWELGLNWSQSPNLTALSLGDDTITVSGKDGWDYLWIEYMPDAGTSGIQQKAMCAYVEQVYDRTAMGGIIPTTHFGLDNPQPWMSPVLLGGAGFQ